MNLPPAARTFLQIMRVESLIAELRLKAFIRSALFMLLAMLAASLCFIMLNVAGYSWLMGIYGTLWTPLLLGIANLVLAGAAAIIALRMKPGPELALAVEVSKTLSERFGEELKPASLITAPWPKAPDAGLGSLLVPAAAVILAALRRRSAKRS